MKSKNIILTLLLGLCMQGARAHKDTPQQMPTKPEIVHMKLQSMYSSASKHSVTLVALALLAVLACSAIVFENYNGIEDVA
jgi:hypothetical protein